MSLCGISSASKQAHRRQPAKKLAKAIQAADDVNSVAMAFADIAYHGSGFEAAAMVRTIDTVGGVEFPASGSSESHRVAPLSFRRALRRAASNGGAAEYSAASAASLQRIEIERRITCMRAALGNAAVAQHFLLPRTPVTATPFVCHGKSLPGDGYLGGDFFDTHILPDGRLAVSLGDVSGHGVPASILMAVAQGFLHAALAEHGDLARAASGLNQFVVDHSHGGQYITLWLGVLDSNNRTLTYINAGHGYAYQIKSDDQWRPLDEKGEPPIGLGIHYVPVTVSFVRGDRLLVISDGIIEQPHPEKRSDDLTERFGFEGVQRALHDCPTDCVIDCLFDAVQHFAHSAKLVDDITALFLDWP